MSQPPYSGPPYGQQPQQPHATEQYQPTFAQQPYAQSDYGQQPYPPLPPPRPKSRALPITLLSIAIVLVLVGGGGFAAWKWNAVNAEAKKTNSTPATHDPTTAATDDSTGSPATSPTDDPTDDPTTAPTGTAGGIKISAPATLGGRAKASGSGYDDATGGLSDGLNSLPGASGTISGVYGDATKKNLVGVGAAKFPVTDPGTELGILFSSFSTVYQIKDAVDVPAGSLGGVAKCGTADYEGTNMALCMWVDSGSFGLLMWYGTPIAKAKSEFAALRGQIETKA